MRSVEMISRAVGIIMLNNNKIYKDIVWAKEYVSDHQYDEIEELVNAIFSFDTIRKRTALLTVLAVGYWNGRWYPQFMMPPTKYCIMRYPHVSKNMGKPVRIKYRQEEEDDWGEGYYYLHIDGFRPKWELQVEEDEGSC